MSHFAGIAGVYVLPSAFFFVSSNFAKCTKGSSSAIGDRSVFFVLKLNCNNEVLQ